jgi:HEAT repeat protein
MRCLGLTAERRRCSAEAIGATGYCEAHQVEHAGLAPASEIQPRVNSRVWSWVNWRRDHSTPRVVPDEARFSVPAWLWTSPTSAVIQQLLHHADTMTRWSAAFTLRKRRDPAAIEPLWEALRHDRSSLVRQQAAVALGKIGTAAARGPLIEGLWHDSEAGVRQACAIALGNLGDRAAAPDLAQALERDPATFVRWDCVLALGQLGDHTVEPLLAELARHDRTEIVRRACRQALADLRRRE